MNEVDRRLYMAQAQARFRKRMKELKAWREATNQHAEGGTAATVDDRGLCFIEQNVGLRGLIDHSIWMRDTTKVSRWKAA